MMHLHKLLLFALLNIGIVEAGKLLQLFEIPSFTLVVELTVSTVDEKDIEESSDIGSKVTEAVQAYLFEEFYGQYGEALKEIEVNNNNNNNINNQGLRVDMIGTVSFIKEKVPELTQEVVSDFIATAFERKNGDENESYVLLSRLQSLQSSIDGVSFVNNQEGDAESITNPNTNPNQNPKIELSTPAINDGKTISLGVGGGKHNAIAASMGAAMTVLALTLFLYIRRDKEVNKSGHLLLNVEQYSDYSDDEFAGELQLDDASYEAFDAEQGIQFIPIPAKIDESKVDKKTKAAMKDVTPKRYVQPESPFELLYGAAFSHRDAAKVARAHGTKVRLSRNRSMKVSGKKIRKKTPLKPMQPITEDQEDAGNEASFIPQLG